MRLRFVPRPGALPRWPGKRSGDYPYVGRRFNAQAMKHETTEDPAEVLAGTKESARLIELCKRDGDLLPFDAETARACDAPFVPLTRKDGEWVPASAKSPKPQATDSAASRKATD